MQGRKRRRLVWLAVCVTLGALALFSLLHRTPYLVLSHAEAAQVLYIAPLSEGEGFSVNHIHSLNQSPVTEIYVLRDGQIMLTAMEFETFGAGMPAVLEPGQTLIRPETGGMRIDGFERRIPDLRYLIGYAAEHTLHIANQTVPLDTLADAGQSVQFTPRQLNLWQRLFWGLCR
ncbi:MAG: DUF1850 domain-containing protein [Oscillospiraceae bacterium]|nr:DUF1850 domain-containing protein [Oscillospiraceae bacterium]